MSKYIEKEKMLRYNIGRGTKEEVFMNQNTWKKLAGILLAIMLITAIFATNVFATTDETAGDGETGEETVTPTFTDFSNATFSITRDDVQFFFNTTGATLKQEERRVYYLFLTNGDEEPVIKYLDSGTFDDSGLGKTCVFLRKNKDDMTSFIRSRLEKSGDIYATILEYDGEGYMNAGLDANKKDFYKTVVTKKKVARPATLPLTQRLTGYFFEDYTTLFDWEIGGNSDKKCNIKIGRVTDNNVLRAIKNGDKNCLSNLLSYAKNADAVYQTKFKLDSSLKQESVIGKFSMVDKAYYFIYFSVDTENGKYYGVEDVMLYQGHWNESVRFLSNYLDKDFTWNIEDEGNSNPTPANNITIPSGNTNTVNNTNKPTGISGNMDNTKASGTIPQTGSIPMVTIGILSVIALVGGFAYYQNKKYKGI